MLLHKLLKETSHLDEHVIEELIGCLRIKFERPKAFVPEDNISKYMKASRRHVILAYVQSLDLTLTSFYCSKKELKLFGIL